MPLKEFEMKKLGILIITLGVLFLSGCSYKNSTVAIAPYKVNFLSFSNKHKRIYINSIKDDRTNKHIVAVITNSKGDNLGYITTTQNFIKWYKNALQKALMANGFFITNNKKQSDMSIDLILKELLVSFNKNEFIKENLTGRISLKLILHAKKETITKNISENTSKYNGLTISKEGFKEQLQTLLNDSVKLIVKNLKQTQY
jgi:uncharacterized lipoprotein YajG